MKEMNKENKSQQINLNQSQYSINIAEEGCNKYLIKIIDYGKYSSDLDYNEIKMHLTAEELLNFNSFINICLHE